MDSEKLTIGEVAGGGIRLAVGQTNVFVQQAVYDVHLQFCTAAVLKKYIMPPPLSVIIPLMQKIRRIDQCAMVLNDIVFDPKLYMVNIASQLAGPKELGLAKKVLAMMYGLENSTMMFF